jgi:hypothetical protein
MKTTTEAHQLPQTTSAEIIAAFGNLYEAAAALGVPIGVISEMYTDGIPHRFWRRAIDAAERLGIPGITLPLLEATYKKPETAKAIITAFGGRVEVAEILGSTKNAVSNWYLTGIPPKFHRRLVEVAQRLGIPDITPELLERTHRTIPATRARRTPVRRRCDSCGCTIIEQAQAQSA